MMAVVSLLVFAGAGITSLIVLGQAAHQLFHPAPAELIAIADHPTDDLDLIALHPRDTEALWWEAMQ